jgi:ribosome-associated protein
MPESAGRDSRTNVLAAARAALDKQAEDVVILDLRPVSTIADFFLVCTADNPRQLDALKDHIEATLLKLGRRVQHTEGSGTPAPRPAAPESRWVLLDCGDLVVHLFDRHAREFYRLEDLWADAPRISIDSAVSH